MVFSSTPSADTLLNATHQSPGGRDDAHNELVQIIARAEEKTNVALKIQVYPGESPFKAKVQWGTLTKSRLDITAPSRWTMRASATRSPPPLSCPVW